MERQRVMTRSSKQRGSAIVEAAFVLLLAIGLLLAIIDFGQMLTVHQAFVQRLRAGSRYAVVTDWDEDPTAAENRIRNVILYNDPDPTALTGMGLLGLTPEMVSITREDANGAPGDEAADRIVVRLDGYHTFLFTPGLAGRYVARPITQSIPVENLGATP